MKKVLIISSSLRTGSNSEYLSKHLYETIHDKTDCEYMSLKGYDINYCVGCLTCQKISKCIINDDMKMFVDKVSKVDCLILATPTYYYGISGLLKVFLDRLNPLYGKDIPLKEVYLIITGACPKDELGRVVDQVQGFVDCFERVSIKASFIGGDLTSPLETVDQESYIKEIESLGGQICLD